MHDTLPWSVAAFPLILDEIAARNAAFVARGEEPYEVVGLEGLREVARLSTRPLVAIGGITLDSATAVIEAGAQSVAVIGALRGGDMEQKAREWIRRLR